MAIYAYIRLNDNKFPLFEGDIRLEHPDIPPELTGEAFPCPDTFAPVNYTDKPEIISTTEKIVCQEAELINGQWQTKWEIIPISQQQLDFQKNIEERQKLLVIQPPIPDGEQNP